MASEYMDSNHAVVTGGAGFLGSHLVDRLISDGFTVTAIDNFTTGELSNLSHHEEADALTVLKHDVSDSLPDIGTVDQIYHLASRATPNDFQTHAVEIAMANSRGTVNVLEYAKENSARVFIASTSEVYGNPDVHPQTEGYNGNVNPTGPRAPYNESKRLAEGLAMTYARNDGVDVRVGRIFNTYGPRMHQEDSRVIPSFVTQALNDQDLTVHGEGTQTRSFCYVTDLIDGIRRLMETEGLQREVFNLGNPNEITILQLAEQIQEIVSTESKMIHESRPTDDPDIRKPDITKARAEFDWSPNVSLDEGLHRTVEYFR